MEFEIHAVAETEAVAASAVVQSSFIKLAAADWEPTAQQWFLVQSSPELLAEKLRVATFASGAFAAGQMVGFLLMPTPTLLGMLFVDPQWLRQGVARTLWEGARNHIESSLPTVKTIELNASPYSVAFYRSVGFVPISAEFKREGCRATRMACWLPARALGAECATMSQSSELPAGTGSAGTST
jgi:predicted GNAT family N-acyltransferase